MAQCGRCGPDGGGDPNSRPRRTLRPQGPILLPDGLGTIQAQLRIDSLTPEQRLSSYSATSELLLDAVMDRAVRLTEVTLRRGTKEITFSITAANPVALPAGRSTVVLRGSTIKDATSSDNGWTLFLRTEARPEGYALNPAFTVAGSEAVALASLSPPRDLEVATVSIRASYLRRTLTSPISAAELQYHVRYRTGNAAASITGLALRSIAAFGPIVIEAPIPSTVVTSGSTGTISFRQILDPSNTAAMAALEAMLQNPSSLYAQLRTSVGNGGALLQKPESFTYAVSGARVTTSATPESAKVSGLVTVETLRDETGKVLAGLANFGLGASGFTRPNTVLTGLTVFVPPVRTLAVQSALNNTSVSASGDTSLYQDYLLLGDDELLTYLLTPATLSARLNTAVDSQGAIVLTAVPPLPELASPAMAITQLLPEISTPGSIVSIFGRSFPARANHAAVTVEGLPAEILYASPNQINIRLPEGLSTAMETSPLIWKTLLLVNIPKATSVTSTLTVDVVEPFIFLGPAIYVAGSGTPVRPATPATAGDQLEIYCTGIAVQTGLKYFVRIGESENISAIPEPVPGVPGAWVIRAKVPSGLQPGNQPLTLFALFDGNPRTFPRVPLDVPLAIR